MYTIKIKTIEIIINKNISIKKTIINICKLIRATINLK